MFFEKKNIEKIKRMIDIIKPKYYSFITKSVIFVGLGIIVESETGILKAIVVDIYIKVFGGSEIFTNLLEGNPSPWLGFSLVFVALVYHYLVTTGSNILEQKFNSEFIELSLLDPDENYIDGNQIQARGNLVDLPSESNIPDYNPVESVTGGGINEIMRNFSSKRGNRDFYRERAQFVKNWAGGELVKLKLCNNSNVLARNISVEFRVYNPETSQAKNTMDVPPPLPKSKEDNAFIAPPMVYDRGPSYDIKIDKSEIYYYKFVWDVGDLQANTCLKSRTYLFIKVIECTEVELVVYCDDFSQPKKQALIINPPSDGRIQLSLDSLTSSEEDFEGLIRQLIMDGQLEEIRDNIQERIQREMDKPL